MLVENRDFSYTLHLPPQWGSP